MSLFILRKCPLFFELYDEEIEKVISGCQVKVFEEGESIVTQGEIGEEFYIVLDGGVSVIKRYDFDLGEEGQFSEEVELSELGPGDVFGELILVNDTYRTASILAKTRTDLLVVDQDKIYSLFKFQSKIFAILVLNLARILSQKLKGTTNSLEKIRLLNFKRKRAA